jgi:hypothetical protein
MKAVRSSLQNIQRIELTAYYGGNPGLQSALAFHGVSLYVPEPATCASVFASVPVQRVWRWNKRAGTPLTGVSYNQLRQVFRTVAGATDRFLGVTVKQDANRNTLTTPTESFPRQQFLSTAFAFQSQYAQFANEATNQFKADKGLVVSGDKLPTPGW